METRWCGDCGSEFVAGYTVCSDCGTLLTDVAPIPGVVASGNSSDGCTLVEIADADDDVPRELVSTSASHFRRIAASLIDGFVVGTARALIYLVAGSATGFVVSAIMAIAYETVSVARYQRGIGKALMGLRIVDVRSGQALSWSRAFVRAIVPGAALVTSFAGPHVELVSWASWSVAMYLPVLINVDRRGLHDFAARSQVTMLVDRNIR